MDLFETWNGRVRLVRFRCEVKKGVKVKVGLSFEVEFVCKKVR